MKTLIQVIFLSIAVIFISGCASNTNEKSDEEIFQEEKTKPLVCIGYIEGWISASYDLIGVYSKRITPNEEIIDMYENCIPENQITYTRINEKTYLLQYAGPDGKLNTEDDYYFFPEIIRGERPTPPRESVFEKGNQKNIIDYSSNYLFGRLIKYWKVFGYYPDNIFELNHPYMDEIFYHVPKSQIVYQKHDGQHFTLVLPGYDKKINTEDDFHSSESDVNQ